MRTPARTRTTAKPASRSARASSKAKPGSQVWFVYLARCNDDSLYCGIARDVAERIAKHDAGKGARYTRGRGPLVVEAVRKCPSHGDALRLELAVKALPRSEKVRLVETRRFRALQRSLESR